MKRGLSAIACLAYVVISASCRQSSPANILSPSDFTRSRKSIESFFQTGGIEKIIVPESTSNSLVAEVNQIAFNKNEDIYLADQYSQNAVFKFDKLGRFMARYGRLGQGPGEFNSFTAFDIDAEGRVFIFADFKLIAYNEKGELDSEAAISDRLGDIKLAGSELYTRIYDSRRGLAKRDFLFRVYDENLKFQRGLFDNDPRLKIYRLLPSRSVSLLGDKIIFTDVYDLAVNIYDPKSGTSIRVEFPNENEKYASVWSKEQFGEEDRSTIRRNIHRFEAVYCFGGTIYLVEINRRKNEVNFWLMDLKRKRIDIYPLLALIGNTNKEPAAIRFDNVIGAYDNGLVFVVDDVEKAERIKKQLPQFGGLQFGINDNPMLVFFRVNENR